MSKKNVGELRDIDLSELREEAKSAFCYTFALRLRDCLKNNNMSQKDLGEKAKNVCSEASITQYLKGKQEPKAEVILCFSDIFNVSTDYLLGKTEIKSADPIVTAICEYTGFNQKTIETMHKYNTQRKEYNYLNHWCDFLDMVYSSGRLYKLSEYVARYINSIDHCEQLELKYPEILFRTGRQYVDRLINSKYYKAKSDEQQKIIHDDYMSFLEHSDEIQPLNLYKLEKEFMRQIDMFKLRRTCSSRTMHQTRTKQWYSEH